MSNNGSPTTTQYGKETVYELSGQSGNGRSDGFPDILRRVKKILMPQVNQHFTFALCREATILKKNLFGNSNFKKIVLTVFGLTHSIKPLLVALDTAPGPLQ